MSPLRSRVTRASPAKATSATFELRPRLGAAPPTLVEARKPKLSPSPLTSSQATLSLLTTGCSWVAGEAETVSPPSSPVSGQPGQILLASKTSRAVRSTTGSSPVSTMTCSTAARASRKPGGRAEPGGQRGVDDLVEGPCQRRVVAGLTVDLGQVDPDRPERVVPDRGVVVHAALVLAAEAEQLEPVARVERAQVVVEVVAGEHVAQRQAAVGVPGAEDGLLGVAGAATLEDRDAVGALDLVADHVAEVVGEALVEGAGLAGVLQPRRGRGDTVGDLVAGGVDLDLGHLGLALRGGARVAVDHLRLAQRAGEEGVAEVGGAVVHRRDHRAALAVPGVAAQRRVVVVDVAAQRVRGHRLGVADLGVGADHELAGQLRAVLHLRGVVRADAAARALLVPRGRGGVEQRHALVGLDAVPGEGAADRVGTGDLDRVRVGRGRVGPGQVDPVQVRRRRGRPRERDPALAGDLLDAEDVAGGGVDVVVRGGRWREP